MPPPNSSLTRRLLHHLLLVSPAVSLARVILTVLGRGRSWDEWDGTARLKLEDEPEAAPARAPSAPQPSKHGYTKRFALALSFCVLFFAGLAFSAGAGDGVRALLETDDSTPAADTSQTDTTATTETERTAVELSPQEQVSRDDVPSAEAPAAPRSAVLSSRPSEAARYARTTAEPALKKATVSSRHAARPASHRTRSQAAQPHRAHKSPPPLDPEVAGADSATV
jgi:hypothetical protein